MTSSTLPDEGERARLTRAAVVDRALALADKSGLDALTIRKLATELGVTPMALYWHFRGKDELLDGLAERLWSEIDLTVDRAAPWTEQIRALLESLLTVLRAHPAAPQLLLHTEKLNRRPRSTPPSSPSTSCGRPGSARRTRASRPARRCGPASRW